MIRCYVVRKESYVESADERRVVYPEVGMSMAQLFNYQLGDVPVVTENPWIIGAYHKNEVRVLVNGELVVPGSETFGASVNKITMTILGRRLTISSAVAKVLDELAAMEFTSELLDRLCLELGDSVEKVLLINRILDKLEEEKK
jgi:hypothetical protein